MNRTTALVVVAAGALLLAPRAFAHCQIPCGIYDDEARFNMIAEDIATVEKAMERIAALSKERPTNYNQLVRWINAKDKHAQEIQDIVAQYFLAQRVKAADEKDRAAYAKYLKQVTLLHQAIVAAMKTKQTTDQGTVRKLRGLIESFRTAYFGPASHEHEHKGSRRKR